MADPAHVATDKTIAKIEARMRKEYKQAAKETQAKLNEYYEAFNRKDAAKKQDVVDGLLKQEEYDRWRIGQLAMGERWETLQTEIAENLTNVDKIARGIANGYSTEIYALNHNFATYQLEKDGFYTAYTLYDKNTVERIVRDNPAMLPPPGKKVKQEIAEGKAVKWKKSQIQSVAIQSILQGESIPQMAQRISETVTTRSYADSVRYARTMSTSAQNAGRYDGYRRAKNLGVDLTIEWCATLDHRTRHEHRQLHGQRRDVDVPFFVDGFEILYPAQTGKGTSNIPQSLIWNCRCTLLAWVKGFEGDTVKESPAIKGKNFEEWQDELMTLDYAQRNVKYLEKVIKKKPGFDEQFSGIWKGKTVSYKDWNDVKDSIPAKKGYYEQEIQNMNAAGEYSKAAFLQKKLDDLERYESHGAEYSQLLSDMDRAQKNVARLSQQKIQKAQKSGGVYGADAYTQARKDAALWAKSPRDADNALRARTGEVWSAASKIEKNAAYEYTRSYHKFNEPLRGIEYGTNRFLGVGNTDLNAGYAQNGEYLNALTDILGKTSYETDVWLQRGVGYSGMDKFFGVDMSVLTSGTEDDLKSALLGKEITEYGFMSCGSSKGRGFSGDILLNIYAPSGTKMMYVEPFSAFGQGDGLSWDGVSQQSGFGYELETLLQQGTRFRVTKVERTSGTIYMDLDVIDQSAVQRYSP